MRKQTIFTACFFLLFCVRAEWTAWYQSEVLGTCSATCGSGFVNMSKSRECLNTTLNQSECVGPDTERFTMVCIASIPHCPVDGRWASWYVVPVGSCSVTCGRGQRWVLKRRYCENPMPRYGGRSCRGNFIAYVTEQCSAESLYCQRWTEWTVKRGGDCSVSCGGVPGSVTMLKTRVCARPYRRTSKSCREDFMQSYTQVCHSNNYVNCTEPDDGGWSEWTLTGIEGTCSLTCGVGLGNQYAVRQRSCSNPKPKPGGRPCVGSETEITTLMCNSELLFCPKLSDVNDGAPTKSVSSEKMSDMLILIPITVIGFSMVTAGFIYFKMKSAEANIADKKR